MNQDQADLADLIELTREIARAYYRMRIFGNKSGIFQDFGSTTAEILSMLYDFGDHSVGEIARMRSVSRQFVVKLVRQLEQEGIVTVSERVAGKRGYVIGMTADGRRQWEARRQQFVDAVAQANMNVAPHEARLACSVLRRVGGERDS